MLILKVIQIAFEPCLKTLTDIMNYLQELEDKESKGIVTPEDISFEGEWNKRSEATKKAVIKYGIKTFSIDIIRKAYDYASIEYFSTRIADRLTKRVEYSAERKLLRYGANMNWFQGRINVMSKLYKTCAYSFILGRCASFTQELISVNVELCSIMGFRFFIL